MPDKRGERKIPSDSANYPRARTAEAVQNNKYIISQSPGRKEVKILKNGMIKYPNLLEAAPYFNFSYFADITPELFNDMLEGNEDLGAVEALKMCLYTGIPFSVLFNPKPIMLSKSRTRHQKMIRELRQKLYEIWDRQKSGSNEAELYMKYGRTRFVNMELDFINKHEIAYCRYLGVKHEMDNALLFIRCEQDKIYNKPRGMKR